MKRITVFLSVLAALFTACKHGDEPLKGRDMVVYGKIYTAELDASGAPVMADAMVIKDGKYVYVGDKAGAQTYITKNMKVVEHSQGLVMPSCTDGHAHYLYSFTGDRIGIAFTDEDGKTEILNKVARAAQGEGNYIFGFGWELSNLIGDTVTRQDLDAICPDKAVFLNDSEVHKALVNTRCLVEAGILSEDGKVLVDSIVGGKIEMDKEGMPTGFLSEQANTYVRAHVPGFGNLVTDAVARQAVERTQQFLLSEGYTAYMDGWSNQWYNDIYYRTLCAMDKEGLLSFNIGLAYEIESWAYEEIDSQIKTAVNYRQKYSSKHVFPRYVKLFMDGTVESGTGYINGEYKSVFSGSGNGIVNWEQEQASDITARANSENLTMHVHAMGDAAVHRALEAYVRSGNDKLRNTLVHVRNISLDKIQQVKDRNIPIDMGVLWHAIPDEVLPLLDECLPSHIAKQAYPMRSFMDKGVNGVAHTDYPATAGSLSDPFGAMEIMVTGRKPDPAKYITPWQPGELLSREQALRALTVNGARQLFMEEERGSVKVGKYADFLLVSKDVLDEAACPDNQIHTAQVIATYFEGKKVYSK